MMVWIMGVVCYFWRAGLTGGREEGGWYHRPRQAPVARLYGASVHRLVFEEDKELYPLLVVGHAGMQLCVTQHSAGMPPSDECSQQLLVASTASTRSPLALPLTLAPSQAASRFTSLLLQHMQVCCRP